MTMYWTVHTYGGPRRVNHAAVVVGNNIFTFGGYCSGVDFNQLRPIDSHVLDTDKLKWLKLKLKPQQDITNVPFQRYGHTAVVHGGSKIYLWGGRNDSDSCNTLFCFDVETQMWSTPKVYGTKPVPRDGHSACVINDCMYIFGGFQEFPSHFSHGLYMLNLHNMMWSAVKTMGIPPSHRDFHTATAIGDHMYIFGGRGDVNAPRLTENEVYCPDIHYYDTKNKTWVQPLVTGVKPPGRRSHSAFVHKGFLYVFGGFNKNLNQHFKDINRYDPLTSTWKTISPKGVTPCARRRQVCLIIKNRVFISGGTSPNPNSFVPLRLMEEYNLTELSLNQLEDHDDLHILDLEPSFKDICLATVAQLVREKRLSIESLPIPASLKDDLRTFVSVKVRDVLSYSEDFPPLANVENIFHLDE